MGVESVYYVSRPEDSNYKPKIVPLGTYYCIKYPECKGIRKIFYTDGELKPCPVCGSLALFRQ